MKLKAIFLSLLIPLTLAGQTTASADASVAIQQMAEALLAIDTTPGVAQRKVLEQIASGTNVTENEQNLAKAILNINGTIRPEDKQLVWAVLRDVGAGEGEKELAKLVNSFDTKASDSERARLSKLLPPKPKQEEPAASKQEGTPANKPVQPKPEQSKQEQAK